MQGQGYEKLKSSENEMHGSTLVLFAQREGGKIHVALTDGSKILYWV